MTVVVILSLGMGLGVVGLIGALRHQPKSLQSVLAGLTAEPRSGSLAQSSHGGTWRFDRRLAVPLAHSVRERGSFERELGTRLALANGSLEDLIARCLTTVAVGFFLPVVTWMLLVIGGVRVPVLVPVGAGAFLGLAGAFLLIAELNAEAKRGRRHAMRVICSFLDLVVLGLAGGMGVESALLAAAQLGENRVSRRLYAALSLCRDTGEPPWEALSRLGKTLGIDELSELAATTGLAAMEGAKVRTTLAARSASIRRHELANAEAEANALTERLFLPGMLLLVGFLIFIGYPAFTRIASGF